MVKVLAWYDNETGYSTRMVDLAAMMRRTALKTAPQSVIRRARLL
jgi:hypothetical protein